MDNRNKERKEENCMRKRKQCFKPALCLLLSAGLVCSDMTSMALAAEEKLETEIMTEIQETE